MDTLNLYDILDFVLNRATSSELDAIRAALRRRETDMPAEAGQSGTGALGINIRDIAMSTAESIQNQVGVSQDGVRDMVHRTVREVISREAPELEPAQVDELLAGIVSDGRPAPASSDETPAQRPAQNVSQNVSQNASRPLPKDVLLSMVGQFVAYSTGAMSVREEMSLTEQMGKWQLRYWEKFPQVVRRLVALFIKGAMSSTDFWRGIDDAFDNPE